MAMAQTAFRTRSAFYRHSTAAAKRTQRAEMPLFQAFLRPSSVIVTDRLCIKNGTTIDHAYGSVNFLLETYILRRLEYEVLKAIYGAQIQFWALINMICKH